MRPVTDQKLPFFFQILIKNDCLVKLGNKPEDKDDQHHHGSAQHLPQAVAEEEGQHYHEEDSMVTYLLNHNIIFHTLVGISDYFHLGLPHLTPLLCGE